jgi:hypothetical protein
VNENEEVETNLEKALFDGLMHRASLACFAVGIFAIASSVAQSILTYSVLAPIEAAIASGSTDPATMTQLGQAMNTVLPLFLVSITITIMLTIFFAYYTFKVGQLYDIGTVKIAGPAYVIMQLAILPVLLAVLQLFPLLPALVSDPSSVLPQLWGLVVLILIGGLAAVAFLLVFIITFLLGLNSLRAQTGVNLFQTAMVLGIIGIVLSFLNSVFSSIGIPFSVGDIVLDIAIITYGLALSKAAKEGMAPQRLRDRLETKQS